MNENLRALATAMLLAISGATLLAQAPPSSLLVPTTTHVPDEFGTEGYTVTVISANSFTSDTQTDGHGEFRDFGEGLFGANSGHFYAGVDIPGGAIIDFIGLESNDYAGDGDNIATLFYVDRYSGTTSGIVSVASTEHAGGGDDSDYNATALGWQLVQNAHNALVLDVYLPGGSFNVDQGGLGWVEIWWKRSVSPGPATATFTDVPTDSPYYKFVEALVAAGITAGYGDGRFGVNDPITRGQMAVFLSSALGLHWPY